MRQQRSSFSTIMLYSDIQSSIPSHQSSIMNPDCSYGSPMGWEEVASRSRTPKTFSFWQWNLIVYWCVFVIVTKTELPVMGDKTGFCRASQSQIIILFHLTKSWRPNLWHNWFSTCKGLATNISINSDILFNSHNGLPSKVPRLFCFQRHFIVLLVYLEHSGALYQCSSLLRQT